MDEPFPYQTEGAAFLAPRERACLFDEPGLGKSRQAIMALDLAHRRRGLIVAPAAVRSTWSKEFKKWATKPRRVIKGMSLDDRSLWLRGKVDVMLLSYEMMTQWAKHLQGDIFDFIIVDESHYVKSKQAARTKALLGSNCDANYGLARWACNSWFLTGTPGAKDPSDVWSTMRFCGATHLTDQIFKDRYFHRREGKHSSLYVPRDNMIDEYKLVWKSCALRRTKKQVGIQLPPIWLTTTSIDGDTEEIKQLLREHPGLEQEIISAIDRGGIRFIEAPHIMTLRRLIGEAKAPPFSKWLIEEMNNGMEKVGVFGIHKRALDHIQRNLQLEGIRVYRFDGDTSERNRQAYVESFRRDDTGSVFLANIRAAGTGVDGLQEAASDVIMFEQEWTPTPNYQAICRYYRLGQKHPTHARFFSLADSIDEEIADRVERQTQNLIKVGLFNDFKG